MRLLTEYRAESKVLFGSDFPFATTEDTIQGLRGLNWVVKQSGLPPVPEEVIEEIIHRDALRLLGLSHPSKKGAHDDSNDHASVAAPSP